MTIEPSASPAIPVIPLPTIPGVIANTTTTSSSIQNIFPVTSANELLTNDRVFMLRFSAQIKYVKSDRKVTMIPRMAEINSTTIIAMGTIADPGIIWLIMKPIAIGIRSATN